MYRTVVSAPQEKVVDKSQAEQQRLAVRMIPAYPEQGLSLKEQNASRKLRVAGYCRVSTNEQSQEGSVIVQEASIRDLIQKKPSWEYVGIYKDKKSGTSRNHRDEFNRMMNDAKLGKIDFIITKSISRFARNTVDALNCIEELRNRNPSVGVVFINEQIYTLDPGNNLLMTVLFSLAQNESYSISANIRWGIQSCFKRGIPQVNLDRMMGYDMDANRNWVVNEEQAEIVRGIYESYLRGRSASGISDDLNERGIKTVNGKNWCTTGILCILENEKYMGDLLLQKTYTKDVLNHRAVENNGEVKMYYVSNHHDAIISREDWIAVQRKICSRARKRKEYNMVQRFILDEYDMLS